MTTAPAARAFDFRLGDAHCFAQGHPSTHPAVTLMVHAGPYRASVSASVAMTPAEARAMAVALEAAATHAENTLESGLGESEAA